MRPREVSGRMKGWFFASVMLMLVHKVECWFLQEWQDSRFFLWVYELTPTLSTDPRDAFGEAVFLVFVTWLFAGLLMGYALMRGGWGPLLALGAWGATLLLETHHVLRSLRTGDYYVGTLTAALYIVLMLFYWSELVRQVHWSPGVRLADGPPARGGAGADGARTGTPIASPPGDFHPRGSR